MILTIYDLSGIQNYIFATSKLREQVGGSKIVYALLNDEMREALSLLSHSKASESEAFTGREVILFQRDEALAKPETDEKTYRIVYIGGGNAVILYRNREYSDFVTRELQKKTLILTGGEIKLCHASIEIQPEEEKKYADLYSELMKELIQFKASSAPIRTACGFSINKDDAISHESITRVEDEDVALSKFQKLKKFEEHQEHRIGSSGDTREYVTDFSQLREDDRKSYIAVVHLDGDSMGRNIEAFVSKLGGGEGDYFSRLNESMLSVAEMSREIDTIYKNILYKTVDEIFPEAKRLPFRPVVEDGDDITFIVTAEKAFEFVESFAKNLLKEKGQKDNYPIMIGNKFKISVSAGIAFVHDKYPFNQAYELAEELCSGAKKIKRNLSFYVSSMDFHIVSGSEKVDIGDFRSRNYEIDGAQLQKRPYFYDESLDKKERDSLKAEKRDYSSFKALLSAYSQKKRSDSEGADVVRSKYKALRDSYAEGYRAAEVQFNIMELRNPNRIDGYKTAFEEAVRDGKNTKVATLFDFIDAMDIGGY